MLRIVGQKSKKGHIKSDFFRNPDFSWAISCRFRKTKLYQNLMRIGGGDSKYTYTRKHTTLGIYILIKQNKYPIDSLKGIYYKNPDLIFKQKIKIAEPSPIVSYTHFLSLSSLTHFGLFQKHSLKV